MKKLGNRSGMTLIEMLVALLILVMMIVGMDTVMDSSMRVYDDATFEADSSIMANIINTSVGDILRYADDVTLARDAAGGQFKDAAGAWLPKSTYGFVFTNYEYGVRDGFFVIPQNSGFLQLQTLEDPKPIPLVNEGVYRMQVSMYDDLMISNFRVLYVAPGDMVEMTAAPADQDFEAIGTIMDAGETGEAGEGATQSRGGYFEISYKIIDRGNPDRVRNESCTVRLMNAG